MTSPNNTEISHAERTVTLKRSVLRALTSNSLPEIQQRHQGRRLVDGCLCERRFAMDFATKRSLKTTVGLL